MADKDRRTDLPRFYEELGANYNEEEVVYRDLRGILRKKFVLKFLKENQGNFLDLGCNAGVYTEHFVGDLVVGVDLSHAVLTQAKKRCPQKKNVKTLIFIKADIENLNFLKNVQFDFILCSEVLEHLFNPQQVFTGIAQLLKSGGKALITTPNYKRKKPTWIQMGELKSCVPGDEYYHTAFRPEELIEFAKSANLCVLDSGTLEWEVKYAAKVPALSFVALRFINTVFLRNKKIARSNQRIFEYFTILVYKFFHFSSLEKLMKPFIREGVRSFVVLSK